jgi:hypothetical protein
MRLAGAKWDRMRLAGAKWGCNGCKKGKPLIAFVEPTGRVIFAHGTRPCKGWNRFVDAEPLPEDAILGREVSAAAED